MEAFKSFVIVSCIYSNAAYLHYCKTQQHDSIVQALEFQTIADI